MKGNKMASVKELAKVDESITIYRYDNGFMIEVSGQNAEEDWITSKTIVTDVEDLIVLLKEATKLPLVR
jgi:hypothetical protein